MKFLILISALMLIVSCAFSQRIAGSDTTEYVRNKTTGHKDIIRKADGFKSITTQELKITEAQEVANPDSGYVKDVNGKVGITKFLDPKYQTGSIANTTLRLDDLNADTINTGYIYNYSGSSIKIDDNLEVTGNIKATVISAGKVNYAVDLEASDAYAITIADLTPATGTMITFKANTANTGACTLTVNSIALDIKAYHDQDPPDNYIEANSMVVVVINGGVAEIISANNN